MPSDETLTLPDAPIEMTPPATTSPEILRTSFATAANGTAKSRWRGTISPAESFTSSPT